MSKTAFQSLIREFGRHIGVPGIAADEDGYVALTFDQTSLHLQFDDANDEVVVFTRLGEVEADRAEEIYGMLLGANLFWQASRGATFSVEPAIGLVYLADRQTLAALSLARLNEWLEGFLGTVAYWQKRLDIANAGGPLTEPLAPDDQRSLAVSGGQRSLEFRLNDV